MIRAIGKYLRDKVAEKDFAETIGGIVREFETAHEVKGKQVKRKVPVDCLALGANCTDGNYTEFIPDSAKGSIFWFEEVDAPRVVKRETRFNQWQATLRLVGWIHTDKLGLERLENCEGCTFGTRIINELLQSFPKGENITGKCSLIDVRVEEVKRMPGKFNPWANYTLDQTVRQFLMLPYEAFGTELRVTWKANPNCAETIEQGDAIGCHSSPIRKKHPKDFTCEELRHEVTGLTEDQLGEDCLDCEGEGGTCDPVTVNRDGEFYSSQAAGSTVNVQSQTSPITLNGEPYGTNTPGEPFNVEHECEDCEECPECLGSDVSINGTSMGTTTPGEAFPIEVENTLGVDVGSKVGGKWIVPVGTVNVETSYGAPVTDVVVASGGTAPYVIPDADCDTPINAVKVVHPEYGGIYEEVEVDVYAFENRLFLQSGTFFDVEFGELYSANDLQDSEKPWDWTDWIQAGATDPTLPIVTQATVGDTCECEGEPATYQLKDSAGDNIGDVEEIAAGEHADIVAPDGTVQLKDSAAANIGSAQAVKSNGTLDVTAPDGAVQLKDSAGDNIGSPVAVKSNGTANATAPDGTVSITDEEANELYSVPVKSNGTASQAIGNTTVNVNGATFLSVLAEGLVNILVIDNDDLPVDVHLHPETNTIHVHGLPVECDNLSTLITEAITAEEYTNITDPIIAGGARDEVAEILIPGLTWAEIQGMLDSGQLEDAEAAICTVCQTLEEQVGATDWAGIKAVMDGDQINAATSDLCEVCQTLAEQLEGADWATDIEPNLSSGQLEDAQASICEDCPDPTTFDSFPLPSGDIDCETSLGVRVSGAGTGTANGDYWPADAPPDPFTAAEGSTVFFNGTTYLFRYSMDSYWYFVTEDGTDLYGSTNALNDDPWDATYSASSGSNPAPTVVELTMALLTADCCEACPPASPLFLKFLWAAGDADTITLTVTSDEEGAFTVFTDDTGSGTITYSLNGAGYAALSGTLTLVATDTITFRRTTTTSAGWVKVAEA